MKVIPETYLMKVFPETYLIKVIPEAYLMKVIPETYLMKVIPQTLVRCTKFDIYVSFTAIGHLKLNERQNMFIK